MRSDTVCAHGQLARSCEVCERDETIRELRGKLDVERAALAAARAALGHALRQRDDAEAKLCAARKVRYPSEPHCPRCWVDTLDGALCAACRRLA